MDPIQTAALVLILISFLPLVICIIKMNRLKKYKAKATITTAIVTASQKKRGFKNSTYYLLDISYSTDTGIQYSGQTITWKKYAAGDSLPLMYVTNDPGNFKTDFGKSLKWLLPGSIVFIILIALFCCWLLNIEYVYQP